MLVASCNASPMMEIITLITCEVMTVEYCIVQCTSNCIGADIIAQSSGLHRIKPASSTETDPFAASPFDFCLVSGI